MNFATLLLALSLLSPSGTYSIEVSDPGRDPLIATVKSKGRAKRINFKTTGDLVPYSERFFALVEREPEAGFTGRIKIFDVSTLSLAAEVTSPSLGSISVGSNNGALAVVGLGDSSDTIEVFRIDGPLLTGQWRISQPHGLVESFIYPIGVSAAVLITTEDTEPGKPTGSVSARLCDAKGVSGRIVLTSGWNLRNAYSASAVSSDTVKVTLGVERGTFYLSQRNFSGLRISDQELKR